jgi:hypothetical protein
MGLALGEDKFWRFTQSDTADLRGLPQPPMA